MAQVNIKLTPIQVDYKELLARKDVLFQSALHRLNQIDKEIQALHNEQVKLEEMVPNISNSNFKNV